MTTIDTPAQCPYCLDDGHLGKCPVEACQCYLGPIEKDPTFLDALGAYISDEGNHVGGVWGDYGQVVVDTSDLWAALTGTKHEWERTSDYAATFNQMREALEVAEERLRDPASVLDLDDPATVGRLAAKLHGKRIGCSPSLWANPAHRAAHFADATDILAALRERTTE